MRITSAVLLLLLLASVLPLSAFVARQHCPALRSYRSTSTKACTRIQALSAKPKVFIDGEAGTTGLQVYDRLSKRDDLEIISAPDELRKDPETRRKLVNEADAVILCTYPSFDVPTLSNVMMIDT